MTIRKPKSRSHFTLSVISNAVGSDVLSAIGDQLIRVSPFTLGKDSATVYLYCEDDAENALAKAIKSIQDSSVPFTMKLQVVNGNGDLIETYSFNGCHIGPIKVGGFDHSSTQPDAIAEEVVLSSYNRDFNTGTILNRICVGYFNVVRTLV